MTTPRFVRSAARQAYIHAMYTARTQSKIGVLVCNVEFEENVVVVTKAGVDYIVPIAASWL